MLRRLTLAFGIWANSTGFCVWTLDQSTFMRLLAIGTPNIVNVRLFLNRFRICRPRVMNDFRRFSALEMAPSQ